MKLVLLKDVAKLGQQGEVKDVSDGYARNYLIPNKLAQVVTPGIIGDINRRKNAQAKKLDTLKSEISSKSKDLSKIKLTIKIESDDNGKLYGAVKASEIFKLLKKKSDLPITEKMIKIDEPIKSLGDHTINACIDKDHTVPIKVKVVKQGK